MNDENTGGQTFTEAQPDKKKRGPKNYFVPPGAKFTIDMGTGLAARRLRVAMKARGESARSTALKSELSADSVRHVLSGKSGKPRMATLKAIATVLNIPIAYLTDEGMPEDVPDPLVMPPPSELETQDTGFGPMLMPASKVARLKPPLIATRDVPIVTLHNAEYGARFQVTPGITVPAAFLDSLPPMFGEVVLCRIPNGLDAARAGEWGFFDQGGALGTTGTRMLRFGSKSGWRMVNGDKLAEERAMSDGEEFPHVWRMVGRLEPVLD